MNIMDVEMNRPFISEMDWLASLRSSHSTQHYKKQPNHLQIRQGAGHKNMSAALIPQLIYWKHS